jgi:hypothetical protein
VGKETITRMELHLCVSQRQDSKANGGRWTELNSAIGELPFHFNQKVSGSGPENSPLTGKIC